MKSRDNFKDSNMISKLIMRLMEASAIGLMIIAYGYSITKFII